MSATGRGGVRAAEDYYSTPAWVVRRLLEAWTPSGDGTWVEPCAGNGAIIEVVDNTRGIIRPAIWKAFELREEERPALERLCGAEAQIANFLHVTDPPDLSVSVVLTNPPFSLAFEFLRQCKMLYPRAEIVFLLRQAFTASDERAAFIRTHYPDKMEVPDRISFDGKGADSADYAWMRWPPGWERTSGRAMLLNSTTLEERKLDKGHRVNIEPAQRSLFA